MQDSATERPGRLPTVPGFRGIETRLPSILNITSLSIIGILYWGENPVAQALCLDLPWMRYAASSVALYGASGLGLDILAEVPDDNNHQP